MPESAWAERIECLFGLIDRERRTRHLELVLRALSQMHENSVPKRRLNQFVAGVCKAYEEVVWSVRGPDHFVEFASQPELDALTTTKIPTMATGDNFPLASATRSTRSLAFR